MEGAHAFDGHVRPHLLADGRMDLTLVDMELNKDDIGESVHALNQ